MSKKKLTEKLFWAFWIIFFILVFLGGFKIISIDKTFIGILFTALIFGGGAIEDKFNDYEERLRNLEKNRTKENN